MEIVVNRNTQAKCLSKDNIACKLCALAPLCLPKGIKDQELQKLSNIIEQREPKKRGSYWFRTGEKFRSIFAVRSGCVKTYRISDTGEEQISGFYLPGDIIGLDAIESGYYSCSAKVLQPSSVCEIPYEKLEALCDEVPYVYKRFINILSREIMNEQWLITLLGRTTAESRVAALLCNISERFALRGYSANSFILGMPRSDIGNYLGLAVETVSRVFSRFHNDELIVAKGKQIRILDRERLRRLAGLHSQPQVLHDRIPVLEHRIAVR